MKQQICIAVACALGIANAVYADTYPSKPIRLVTAAPGGGVDFAARIIGQAMTERLGQPVVVENRGGAAGAIAADITVTAPPDGYTILLYGSPIWLAPYMRKNVPYDPIRDFAPITLTTMSPTILVVHPSLPANSVRELIALAKAKPGTINCAVGGAGTASHLAVELFKSMSKIDIALIPYKGSSPALNALLGREVLMIFANTAAVAQHLKSGRLRALGVTSAKPSALAPDVPTVAASGLPGYESVSIYGLLAPAKTPRPIITLLNREAVKILNEPQVKQKLLDSGVETVGDTPEQFAAAIKTDMKTLGKVIKEAGIQME
jgi:tripartite-type tricarboxylate transporter receptor subunit TctC